MGFKGVANAAQALIDGLAGGIPEHPDFYVSRERWHDNERFS